jgi:FAD synthase
LAFEREFQIKYPEEDDIDLKDLENALEGLRTQDIVVGNDWEYGTPTVYTASELIDRAEAERMIAVLMRTLGFNSIRFKWKRPRFIVRPMG